MNFFWNFFFTKKMEDENRWLAFRARVKSQCVAYATILKTKKIKKDKRPYHHALEKFLKQLLRCIFPQHPEEIPKQCTLDKLTKAIHDGLFLRKSVRIILRKYQGLPIHPDLIRFFLTPSNLDTLEMSWFAKFQSETFNCEKSNFQKSNFEKSNAEKSNAKNSKFQKSLFVSFLDQLRQFRRIHAYDASTFPNMDFQHAIQFCANKGDQFKNTRVCFLLACGFDKKNLQKAVDSFVNERTKAIKMFKDLRWPLARISDSWTPLYFKVGPLQDAVAQHTQEQLQEIVSTNVVSHRRTFALKLMCHVAKESGRIWDKCLQVSTFALDRFRRTSKWHEQVICTLLEYLREKQHVAFPETHKQLVLSQFCAFIVPIEKYAMQKCAMQKYAIDSQEEDNAMQKYAIDSQKADTKKDCKKGTQELKQFLWTANVEALIDAIRHGLRCCKVKNHLVKSARGGHHATSAAVRAIKFLDVLRPFLGCASKNLHQISTKTLLRGIANKRKPKDVLTTRRTFTDDECDRMLQHANDPCETLCLTLLREIGLRNGALQHVQYGELLDENHAPRQRAFVREKGNKVRLFTCSPNLQKCTKECSEFLRKSYTDFEKWQKQKSDIFILNANNLQRPLSRSFIGVMLKRIARDANIVGVHVHAHAFRHSLVTKLISLGNSVDVVAKFIGHADSRTTSCFYWVPQMDDIEKLIINPFAEDYKTKQEKQKEMKQSLVAAKTKMADAHHMLDVLISLSDDATLAIFREKIPDFESKLAALKLQELSQEELSQEELSQEELSQEELSQEELSQEEDSQEKANAKEPCLSDFLSEDSKPRKKTRVAEVTQKNQRRLPFY